MSLKGNNITVVSWLSNFTNLKVLTLSENNITNIQSLNKLTNLEYLYLSKNSVTDFSPLSNLPKLKTLDLSKNNMKDFSSLASLTNVTSLDLSGNNMTDVSQLSKLTNLEYINLNENNIADVLQLSNLSKLKNLSWDQNDVKDFLSLSKLTSVTGLSLRGNNITDISSVVENLSKLTNLTTLDLSENNIKDFSPLSRLTNITSLYLNKNNITDVSSVVTSLNNLSNLTQLSLNRNKIKNISSLSKLTNITGLWLDENNITDISSLNNLNNLKSVSLMGNNIEDFSSLDFSKIQLAWLREQSISTEVSNNTNSVNYPKVFIDAKNESSRFYTEDEFEYTGCKENSNGTGVILDQNIKTAKVTIKSGEFLGSEWTITVDSKEPEILEQIYYDDYKNTQMWIFAIITVNKPIKEKIDGASTSFYGYCDEETAQKYGSKIQASDVEDNSRIMLCYNKDAYKEIINESITLYDFVGNEITTTVNIDFYPLELTVTKKVTNKDVTVTVEANEDIELVQGKDWTIEGARKLTKKYTENSTETIIVQDKNGNKTEKTITAKIDNEAPNISSKDIKNLEDGSLEVQITLSEPIKIVSKQTNWQIRTVGVENMIWNIYTEEADDTVEVEDSAGNKKTLYIKVKNVNGKLEAYISDTNEDTDNKEDTTKYTDSKDDTTKDTHNKEDTTKDTDSKDDTSKGNDSTVDTSKDNDNKTNSNIDSDNKEEGNNTSANNDENNNGSSNSSNNSSKDSNKNNSQNDSQDSSKITSRDKEENLATSRLPQTGSQQAMIMVILGGMLFIVVVVSGGLYIRYKKEK